MAVAFVAMVNGSGQLFIITIRRTNMSIMLARVIMFGHVSGIG